MFSRRLREVRVKNKLTQEQLAKKIKTTKATISNYENDYSSPSNDVLKDLANVLETTTDWLLGRYTNDEKQFIDDIEGYTKLKDIKEKYDFDITDLTDEELRNVIAYIRVARSIKLE